MDGSPLDRAHVHAQTAQFARFSPTASFRRGSPPTSVRLSRTKRAFRYACRVSEPSIKTPRSMLPQGEPVVLYRTEATVRGALLTLRKGAPDQLGNLAGPAAILKFLRVSLRVRSAPYISSALALHHQGKKKGGLGLPTIRVGELLELMESPEGHKFVADLERDDRFSDGTLQSRGLPLRHIYLGARGGWVFLRPADGTPTRHEIIHDGPELPRSSLMAMWKDISNGSLSVAQYAEKHIINLLDGPAELTSSESVSRPRQVVVAPKPAVQHSTKTVQVLPSHEDLEKYVVLLSTLHRKPGKVPLRELPSRQLAIEFLSQRTQVLSAPTQSRKAPHSIAIVAGEFGIGKTDLILEWLSEHARVACPGVTDVLYITNCATKTEDEVCAHVRHYMESSTTLPLIVLDGLQLSAMSGTLLWVEGLQATQGGLVQALVQAVGKRAFAAVLGARSNRRSNAMPAGLAEHPDIPEFQISESHWLEPYSLAESSTFLREVSKDGPPIPAYTIKKLAEWGRGNPLLLTLATSTRTVVQTISHPDDSSDVALTESQESLKTGRRVIEVLKALDHDNGGQYAAMRFVSLFRRPQPLHELQAVLQETIAAGQPIGRLTEESLRQEIEAQTLFAEGSGNTIELHPYVKDVLTREMDSIITAGEDLTICAEIKALHVTAARRAWERLNKRAPEGAGRTEKVRFTQVDVELAFDCIHHLLGTRSIYNTKAPPKSNRLLQALQGNVSNEEIEHVCLKHVLNERKLMGNSLAARGLFGHRLATLHRFVAWPEPKDPTAEYRRVRRTVRYELSTCSMVAGGLTTARRHLAHVFLELRELQSSVLDGWFYKALRGASISAQLMQEGLLLCDEYAKVVSAYATVLFRLGEVDKATEILSESLRNFVAPIEEVLGREHQYADGRNLGEAVTGELDFGLDASYPPVAGNEAGHTTTRRGDREVLLRSRRRVVTRHAEALLLSTRLGESCVHQLLKAKNAFDSVDVRLDDIHRSFVGGARLVGEAARAYVRLVVALSHVQPESADTYVATARELLANQREVIRREQAESGWTNDAIGALLDEVTLDRLALDFDGARAKLAKIDASPEYRNLGGCSMALKCEVKLAFAKHELASTGMAGLSSSTVKDLTDLAISAHLTSHALIRIDALLLLAIAATGGARKSYLDQARQLVVRCPRYLLREDTFRLLESGDPPTQALSVFC